MRVGILEDTGRVLSVAVRDGVDNWAAVVKQSIRYFPDEDDIRKLIGLADAGDLSDEVGVPVVGSSALHESPPRLWPDAPPYLLFLPEAKRWFVCRGRDDIWTLPPYSPYRPLAYVQPVGTAAMKKEVFAYGVTYTAVGRADSKFSTFDPAKVEFRAPDAYKTPDPKPKHDTLDYPQPGQRRLIVRSVGWPPNPNNEEDT